MLSAILDRIPRLTFWAVISLVLLAAIGLISPIQLPVVLYKLCLVTLGVTLGYWLHRALFPYARPHLLFDIANRLDAQGRHERGQSYRWQASLATLCRALIVLACVLGLTLGL